MTPWSFNNPSSNILQRANTPTQKDTDLGSPLQKWMPGSREMRVARLYHLSTSGVILSLHHGHLWLTSATFWGRTWRQLGSKRSDPHNTFRRPKTLLDHLCHEPHERKGPFSSNLCPKPHLLSQTVAYWLLLGNKS